MTLPRATGRQNTSTISIDPRQVRDPDALADLFGDGFLWLRNSVGQIRSFVLRDIQTQIPDRWIAPTLENSWINADTVEPSYWKDPSGWIHLRGSVSDGTYGASRILLLPVGYRPDHDVYCAAYQNNATYTGPGEVVIDTGGQVFAPDIPSIQTGVSTWLSLDNIAFEAQDMTVQSLSTSVAVDTRGLAGPPSDVTVVDCWAATHDLTAYPLPRIAWQTFSGQVYLTQVSGLPPGLFNLRLLIVAEPA